jgi:hypothetical protein
MTPERIAELELAEAEGRLMVIDRGLYCRKARQRVGRCVGYYENMFSHNTLKMCKLCKIYDPTADDDEDYDEEDEE